MSLAIVGHWFVSRIDKAMAVYSVIVIAAVAAAALVTSWPESPPVLTLMPAGDPTG